MKHEILCVDDESDNVDALERLFRRDYQVFKATSGADALEVLKEHPKIALIISDQRMPHMLGVEFLNKSIKSHPDAIRILLTGYTDIDSVIGAINSGHVYRYITKPWDPVDLKNSIDKAIEKYELSAELKEKNAALKNALDELQTLDDAKNQFMVLINHELKTPLTVIMSFLDLLKETELDLDQKKYVDRISSSSDRLKKIVDEVLQMVSAETGILKLNPHKTTSKKLIERCLGKIKESAELSGFDFDLDVENINLKVDETIVGSVLERILDNAIKFGDKKSTITIKAQEEGDQVILSVTNSGKSMSAKVIDKILKPFSVDEDIMHHSKGLGLGLSLSQALLKRHGSKLEIESPKGQVTVGFRLPKA